MGVRTYGHVSEDVEVWGVQAHVVGENILAIINHTLRAL